MQAIISSKSSVSKYFVVMLLIISLSTFWALIVNWEILGIWFFGLTIALLINLILIIIWIFNSSITKFDLLFNSQQIIIWNKNQPILYQIDQLVNISWMLIIIHYSKNNKKFLLVLFFDSALAYKELLRHVAWNS